MIKSSRYIRLAVYANALLLGFSLMGYEMLGSRYLSPYFGSGINAWASLISTVLGALIIGYFVGGNLVDRYPSTLPCGILVVIAGCYMFITPLVADEMFLAIIDWIGDGAFGVVSASMALLLIPLSLIGTFSPFGVRLLLVDAQHGGRITGRVYGISTIGNIAGTIGVTFFLIPIMGIRAMTLLFAFLTVASGISLMATGRAQWR